MIKGVEKTSRLRITALICNTNLGHRTEAKTVIEGCRLVAGVAGQLGLPVAYIAARREVAVQLDNPGVPVLPIDIFMKPPWED